MSIGQINFKFNDLGEAQALSEVVDQKLGTLARLLNEGSPVTCDVEFEKVAPQQSGEVHRVEVNLMVDGTLYRADATEANFEKAIDEVRDELDKELRRAKDKQDTLRKQAGREFKERMLGE